MLTPYDANTILLKFLVLYIDHVQKRAALGYILPN